VITSVLLDSDFEGLPLCTFSHDGRLAWLARQAGAALGYSNGGKRLETLIHGEWAQGLVAGRDYTVLEGESLAAFVVQAEGCSALGEGRAHRKLILLYEPGLLSVFSRTSKPVGRRLHRFLVEQLGPLVAEPQDTDPRNDAPYDTEPQVTAPFPAGAPTGVVLLGVHAALGIGEPSLARERRLTAKLELEDRKFRSGCLRRTLDMLHALGVIEDSPRASFEILACELAMGRRLPTLRRAAGVTAVDRIARQLGDALVDPSCSDFCPLSALSASQPAHI
jgi:hypothetical protein